MSGVDIANRPEAEARRKSSFDSQARELGGGRVVPPPGGPVAPAGGNNHPVPPHDRATVSLIENGGTNRHDLAGTYNTRFGILGGIGIFGAGAAFGPIFQSHHRAFNDILAGQLRALLLPQP